MMAGVAVLLAGCTAVEPLPSQDLLVSAAWADWEGEALPHLHVEMRNLGSDVVSVGPGGQGITVAGPTGRVPMAWGSIDTYRDVQPQERVVLVLHPRMDAVGRFVLAVDHAFGVGIMPPLGVYEVCVGNICATAAQELAGVAASA